MEGLLQGGGGVQRAEQNAARLSQHLLARISTFRSPASTNILSSSPVFEHESASGHHNRPVSLSRRCTTLMISEESIHITMPVVHEATEAAASMAEHLECQEFLLQHAPRGFHWNLRLGPTGPTLEIDIQRCHAVQQIPVLESMFQFPCASSDGITSSQSSADSSCKRRRVSSPGNHCEASQPTSQARPFEIPGAGCGLTCMLLLLEGSATCMDLFCGPCGHRLAAQCLWVCLCMCVQVRPFG